MAAPAYACQREHGDYCPVYYPKIKCKQACPYKIKVEILHVIIFKVMSDTVFPALGFPLSRFLVSDKM